VPIFDAGKNQANLDIARVEKRIEVANYESHPDRVQGSVRCAGRAGHLRDELTAREQDADANQRYYDLAQARYQEGMDSYLNLLVAQRSLYQAQQTKISTQLSTLAQQTPCTKCWEGWEIVTAAGGILPTSLTNLTNVNKRYLHFKAIAR
jgi:multidrug efflux system outer membrane protein